MKINILLLVLVLPIILNSQTSEERLDIVKSYNLEKLKSMELSFRERDVLRKKDVDNYLKINGVKKNFTDINGSYYELMYIENGMPIYYKTDNSGSANTIKVNRINSGGSAGLNLNGQNMIIGIWDGGAIRLSHQDILGRVTIKDGENFLVSSAGTAHAIHVSGTIMGSGYGSSSAKGLAYQANLWSNTFANDETEVLSQISQGLIISNHSYGIPAESVAVSTLGAYTLESHNWDNILFNAPYYQAVISAGNDRGSSADTKGGRDLLVGNKVSKNTIVVAAVNNVNNYNSPASVVMSSFSSWGPTDDYRIKPDISAKGVNVYSLDSTSDTAYASNQGTSMSAPAVTAALALLQQHYNELYSSFMKAATLKAIMVNSADEAGDYDGPDYKFGWGLLNAERGAKIISDKATGSSVIMELNLLNNSTYTLPITASSAGKIKATLVWTDPAGSISNGILDDSTPRLVNDLDLRIVKNTDVFYPWVLNPFFIQGGAIQDDNVYDNVECVDVNNASGVYTLSITHKGVLVNGNQNFSLVISGVNQALGFSEFDNSTFDIYPNPANDIINIVSKIGANNETEISIYSMQGRKVKSFNCNNFNNIYSINVEDVNSGVYLIEIKSDKYIHSSKIVIN